jgi:hypothetical protein
MDSSHFDALTRSLGRTASRRQVLKTLVGIAAGGLLARVGVRERAARARETIANDPFLRTWSRTDRPVAEGRVVRTWMWGPEPFTPGLLEPYQQSPNGQRVVQYFDKSRMEITHPGGDQNSIWYVTNGLLVVEMVTGRMQVGDASFENRTPAQVNVAGDSDDPTGPTYATFTSLRNAPPAPQGSLLIQRVDRNGAITTDDALTRFGVTAAHRVTVPNLDHQIASPFWSFMNSEGLVYENGQYVTARLFPDPFYATGLPITEAYWARVKVDNRYRDVLMQCFERRCLTYTPDNPPAWQVEAGNVGRHYHTWRSRQLGLPDIQVGAAPPAVAEQITAAANQNSAYQTLTDLLEAEGFVQAGQLPVQVSENGAATDTALFTTYQATGNGSQATVTYDGATSSSSGGVSATVQSASGSVVQVLYVDASGTVSAAFPAPIPSSSASAAMNQHHNAPTARHDRSSAPLNTGQCYNPDNPCQECQCICQAKKIAIEDEQVTTCIITAWLICLGGVIPRTDAERLEAARCLATMTDDCNRTADPSGMPDCEATCRARCSTGCLLCAGLNDPRSRCCSDACTDTLVDGNNCGSCGNSCGPNHRCCNGACVDLTTDDNCGACGNVCGVNQTCRNGVCTGSCGGIDCAAGQTCCASQCVDLRTNPNHCGECGRVCGAGQTCQNGQCVGTCGGHVCSGGHLCCNNQCIDPRDNNQHCGACGNQCLSHETCQNGNCVRTAQCGPGFPCPNCGYCDAGVCYDGTCCGDGSRVPLGVCCHGCGSDYTCEGCSSYCCQSTGRCYTPGTCCPEWYYCAGAEPPCCPPDYPVCASGPGGRNCCPSGYPVSCPDNWCCPPGCTCGGYHECICQHDAIRPANSAGTTPAVYGAAGSSGFSALT